MKKRIGVLGGTFNPPHLGHLAVAREALRTLSLDAVWVVPSGVPVHKPAHGVETARHRLAMCRKLFRGEPACEVREDEVRRKGPSYSYDTMARFTTRYPDVEFYFLAGSDSVATLTEWHRWKDLLKLCRFAVYPRRFSEKVAEQVKKKTGPALFRRISWDMMSAPEMKISSSLIRARVRRGFSVESMTGVAVARYIAARRLYRGA